MEITLAGGVLVDLATTKDLAAHHDRLAHYLKRPEIRARRIAGAVQTPLTTPTRPLLINCQKPPNGALWAVQWVLAQGVDPVTAAANVSLIGFIGAAASGVPPSIVGLGGGSDQANAFTNGLAVPSLTTIPDKTIVYPSEDLYFLVVGTGANLLAVAQYRVVVGVLEVPNTPEALTWL